MWILIGLVLVVLGGFGVLANQGRLSFLPKDETLLPSAVVDLWQRGDPWNIAIPIAVGIVLAVLGFVLFGKEFRRRSRRRMGDLTVSADPGRTVVRANGLTGALANDLSGAKSIVKAGVVLTGRTERPHVWLRIDLAPGARVLAAHEHVEAAMERFTTTSGITPAAIDVTVRPANRRPSRVR